MLQLKQVIKTSNQWLDLRRTNHNAEKTRQQDFSKSQQLQVTNTNNSEMDEISDKEFFKGL
jgi:hypothetical protein